MTIDGLIIKFGLRIEDNNEKRNLSMQYAASETEFQAIIEKKLDIRDELNRRGTGLA